MASKPWTEPELDELRAHADDECWLAKLGPGLAARSYHALRTQMALVRRDLGVTTRRGRPNEDDWQQRAILGTRMLGEATKRLGMWS